MIEMLLASLVFAGPTVGQSYGDCLTSVSATLEPSNEPASDIARATIMACKSLEVKPTADNILGQMTPEDRKSKTLMLRAAFEDELILRIVRYRACKKTVGCNVNLLPPTL